MNVESFNKYVEEVGNKAYMYNADTRELTISFSTGLPMLYSRRKSIKLQPQEIGELAEFLTAVNNIQKYSK